MHDLRAGRLLQAHKSDAVGASLTGMSIPKSMPGRRWMDDGRSLGGTSETTVRTDTPIVDIVEVNGGWRNEEIPSGGTVAATSMSMGVSGNVTGSSSGSTRKGKGKA